MTAIPPRPPWSALAVAGYGTLLATLAAPINGLAQGELGGAWSVSADEASWLGTMYDVGQVAGIPFVYLLVAGLGSRKAALFAGFGFGATALVLSGLPPLFVALILRLGQGVCAGMLPVLFMLLVMGSFPPGRGQPAGLAAYAFSISLSLGFSGFAAGLLLDSGGVPGLFVAQGLAGLAYGAATLVAFPRSPPAPAGLRGGDWGSWTLLVLTLVPLVIALSQGERRFWTDKAWIVALLAASAVALPFLLRHLLACKNPLIQLRLLLRPTFGWAIALAFCFRFGVLAASFIVPQALLRLQGYRPGDMGTVLVAMVPTLILAFPFAFWLTHRVDGRLSLAIGLLLYAASALVAATITPEWAASEMQLSMALVGAGQAFFIIPVVAYASVGVTKELGSTVGSIFNLTRIVGQAAGTAFLATLITEREKWHSARLVESLAATDPLTAERIAQLSAPYARLSADVAGAQAAGVGSLSRQVATQAYALAFADTFLIVAVLLAGASLLVWMLPGLPRPAPTAGGGPLTLASSV